MSEDSIYGMYNLQGKTAVVTGGGGVLCSEICVALARAGAQVAILDMREDKAQEVAERIRAAHGTCLAIQCNVLDKKTIQSAAQQVLETYGKVDILINGAGGN
ncbi:MAG: SDR family NAD(P)-dependent oxidoreductase, partial [Anaerolineaceae bacterium]|nr:SDR family NAD(P)-dependent oxidoreductase [Anaerolineaceae bacterium]